MDSRLSGRSGRLGRYHITYALWCSSLITKVYTLQDKCVYLALEAIEQFTWHDEEGKRLRSCILPV
jgi:hypothetical protein